jgi:RNA polymerase sigma-70 factor (ECF subfamily)
MHDGPALAKFPAHHPDGHFDSSDERLVERVAAGDRLAMQVLYARHHVRVYRFVLRIVNNAATAEDLTSDAFLDVWRHAGRFEGRSQVSTWIFAIARYKAVAALRRRTNDPLDDEIACQIPDTADGPEAIVQMQNESAVLRQCLTQLSPAHREVIDLVYYHEKSIAEVAEIIGAPQNTVKTRMFHARKQIAALLDARGFDAAA